MTLKITRRLRGIQRCITSPRSSPASRSCSISSLPSGVERRASNSASRLPAISGNPDFERVFRVQMNTLEWLPIFLPSLWLFAIYISDGSRGRAGRGLGRRPHPLHARLCEGRRETRPGICYSGAGRPSCSGSARSARSCGGWFMGKANRVESDTAAHCADRGTTQIGDRASHFVSGQPLSLAEGNALSPGTTASCL